MTIFAGYPTRCPLFDSISPEDLPGMLACLGARSIHADKGSVILREGSPAENVGFCSPAAFI